MSYVKYTSFNNPFIDNPTAHSNLAVANHRHIYDRYDVGAVGSCWHFDLAFNTNEMPSRRSG